MSFNWVDFRNHLKTKMPGSIQQLATKEDIADFARLAVGVLVFLLLLVFPPPPWLNSVVIDQYSLITLLVLIGFSAFLLNRDGGGWEVVQISFIFALFEISLIYQWQFAQYDGNLIGGLLPWSDAAQYNREAHLLSGGSSLTIWGARRPLFSGFLASLFYSVGGDFIVTLIILTLLNALAVHFVVRILKQLFGPISAAFFLVFSFEFYTRFAAVTTSEQLGFAAGNFALFFLLVGTYRKSLWNTLFGLGLLTLALNARAGAFFVLPSLLLWVALAFRRRTSIWRAAGSGILVVVFVFLLNLMLVRVIAQPQSTPFSNYSYTLYGLASGNKGWDQVIRDYPNASEKEIMPLAIQKIRSEPVLFLQGMISSLTDYFSPARGAFTFSFHDRLRQPVNFILWGLVILGLAYSIAKWQDGLQGLVLASFLGVIASIPLLPPIDSDKMRVYAATIPFSALWVVSGVSVLTTWGSTLITKNETRKIENTSGSFFQKPALLSSVLLVSLAVPAPLLLRVFAQAPNSSNSFSQPVCEVGEELINVSKLKNISVVIIQNEAALESYVPFIRIYDFQSAVRKINANSLYPYLDEELLHLKAGDQISIGLKLTNSVHDKSLWMVSDFPLTQTEFYGCGHNTRNMSLQPHNFYYLDGQPVSPHSLTVSQENPTLLRFMRGLYGLIIGIVLLLMIRATMSFKQYSLISYLYPLGTMMLIFPTIFISLYVDGKLSSFGVLTQQRVPLEMQNVVSASDNLYILSLGIDWMSNADLAQSPAMVYENDIPLGYPNAMHQDIMETGNGRYSVWEGYLYFSSSDNTDPRINGRVYELEWPRPISVASQRLIYFAGFLGIAMIVYGKYFAQKSWTEAGKT